MVCWLFLMKGLEGDADVNNDKKFTMVSCIPMRDLTLLDKQLGLGENKLLNYRENKC